MNNQELLALHTVPNQLLQQVLNYLSKRPYEEVAQMINLILHNSPQVGELLKRERLTLVQAPETIDIPEGQAAQTAELALPA